MTRRRFLALFGGFLAAVTAAFPALRRSNQLIRPPGLIGPRKQTSFPVWDGQIAFHSEANVGGVHVQPGQVLRAGNQCGKTNAQRAAIEAYMKGLRLYS